MTFRLSVPGRRDTWEGTSILSRRVHPVLIQTHLLQAMAREGREAHLNREYATFERTAGT